MKSKSRHNPAPPRSEISVDFWIAVVASATKSRQVAATLREFKGSKASLDDLCDVAGSVLEVNPRSIRTLCLRHVSEYLSERFRSSESMILWIVKRDEKLAAWCLTRCLLRSLKDSDPYMSFIEDIEQCIQGNMRAKDIAERINKRTEPYSEKFPRLSVTKIIRTLTAKTNEGKEDAAGEGLKASALYEVMTIRKEFKFIEPGDIETILDVYSNVIAESVMSYPG